MLNKVLGRINLKEVLAPRDFYKPFPVFEERKIWEELDKELREYYINKAGSYMNYQWQQLTATCYMEYKKSGNRTNYQEIIKERRKVVISLLLAECMEGKGRFVNDIINGVWCICEETSWVAPAHNNYMLAQKNNVLPDIELEVVFIDLFSAETASLLTWVYYFLKNVLDTVSPLICKRIKYEINRRIIEPYLKWNHMRWMGFVGNKINNWNPWINSNVLAVFLLILDDEDKREMAIEKCIRSLNNFINSYNIDGGCNEGPQYWNAAGASLFDCLEMLYEATGGKIDLFGEEKIKNIGRYILNAHIADGQYANFADALPKVTLPYDLIYRYGSKTCDRQLMDFGAGMFNGKLQMEMGVWHLYRAFKCFMNYSELSRLSARVPVIQDVCLEGLQFMVARENIDSSNGLYLAAKGGHNNENHNHNDVGSFIVYYDGTPIIIDVGVETYSAKTFSADRYKIWTMQSSYHNLPEVNGRQQHQGVEHAAENLKYSVSDDIVRFSMNIGKAYPHDAGIENWERAFVFSRNGRAFIEITDRFELSQSTDNIILNLMTSQNHSIKGNGRIIFECIEGSGVIFEYDGEMLEASSQTIEINDPKLLRGWGRKLYRVQLKIRKQHKSGTVWGRFLAL